MICIEYICPFGFVNVAHILYLKVAVYLAILVSLCVHEQVKSSKLNDISKIDDFRNITRDDLIFNEIKRQVIENADEKFCPRHNVNPCDSVPCNRNMSCNLSFQSVIHNANESPQSVDMESMLNHRNT
jgi:hypothetical protein